MSSWDDDPVLYGLGECPSASLRWAALGYRAGIHDGRCEILAAIGEAGDNVRRAASPVLKQPALDTLLGRRDPDFRPCPARCQRCARCIASMAYWARGGRPYLGLEQEAALAREAA